MPSEVLKNGDTADVQCAELAIQYEAYLNKKANNSKDGTITPDVPQEELLNMLKRVKQKNETASENK